MKQSFSLALDDDLQKAYLDFKERRDFNQDVIIKLLKYYKGPFATNTAQYKRIGREPSNEINQQLRGGGYTNQTLEELASAMTKYKLILSLDKNTFPYVNINGDNIENNLSGCFYRGESRDKAIQHIKALCKGAEEIYIYDKYLVTTGKQSTNNRELDLIASLLPKKKMKLLYQEGHLLDTDVNYLKTVFSTWNFQEKNNIPEHHDRYLIIDNKMEVILTSGFYYLENITKEFTYIVRPIEKNRFE